MLLVQDLCVHIAMDGGGQLTPVDNITFHIPKGKTLALVGESGSGKSLTALAVMGLLPDVASIGAGSRMTFTERSGFEWNLTSITSTTRRGLRGTRMSMVFQDPMTALNPAMTIGRQLAEVMVEHHGTPWNAAQTVALEKLRLVGITEPEQRLRQYPYELSGGMCQRVMIAMALMLNAELFIADEPTTALDVTIQAQILELLKQLQTDLGLTILLITHDMGVVADMAHEVRVMKDGKIVEAGTAEEIFATPEHPYTQRLLSAVPRLGQAPLAPTQTRSRILLRAADVHVEFPVSRGIFRGAQTFKAVRGVDLEILEGEVLALVGESGCGKTTLGRALLGLTAMFSTEFIFDGLDCTSLTAVQLRRFRRQTAMIFQDPYGSLDPRMTVHDIIAQPLRVHRACSSAAQEAACIEQLLRQVGLFTDMADRYPHEFSGGQRQRIGIARALALNPKFIVCDEPTSALDVSIRAEIINLLRELRRKNGLTMLFISHDLATVDSFADRVAVMYAGQIVELGTTKQVIRDPKHPYTKALLSAALIPDPKVQKGRVRTKLEGQPPSPMHPPSGCAFHPRCPVQQFGCASTMQVLRLLDNTRKTACAPLQS